ncbi:hypothetical protein V6N11_075200 [Hibiscus sabdariffa]|uniref:Thioredoxin domain-containing protein n=1 Tax=Hibiscus sabdariffa TaxID=183260 RepID=A0ABR2R6B1_9ROSI
MRGRSIVRPFLLRQAFNVRSISSTSRIPLAQGNIISASAKNPSIPKTPSSVWTPRNPNLSRSFSNANLNRRFQRMLSPLGQKKSSTLQLAKLKANQCLLFSISLLNGGYIGSILVELARRTPEVTIYKMDIDEERLAGKLKELNITSVPTVHYFKEGKKEDEVVGADTIRIVHTMQFED